MKVLISGAGGQLGSELERVFEAPGHHQVLALGRREMDIDSRDRVEQVVGAFSPDLVLNAAAMTGVDACQDHPDSAWRTNALAVRHLAQAAARVGARVLHISTDYVFDGTAVRPYTEWDATGPRSVYGASKLGGEKEVLGVSGDNCVVRTSWLVGAGGSNMVKTVLRLLSADAQLHFVDDQVGSPTLARDLAEVIYALASARRAGLYHVTNQGSTSWYGLAVEVARLSGHDPERVVPISTAQLDPPRPAPRPAYSVLDNAALRLEGIELAPHYSRSLEELVAQLVAQ